ncbi:MAG: hypothetical protein V1856_00630 [Candidatus Liptonbacteria bacterium]
MVSLKLSGRKIVSPKENVRSGAAETFMGERISIKKATKKAENKYVLELYNIVSRRISGICLVVFYEIT